MSMWTRLGSCTLTSSATILPSPNLVLVHGKVQTATTLYGTTAALGIHSSNLLGVGQSYGGGATDLLQLVQAADARVIGILNDASATADSIAITNVSKTSGRILNVFHNASAFSGDGLSLNLANGSGTFTGAFARWTKATVDRFVVDSIGSVTFAGHLLSTASGAPATSTLGANVTSVTFTGNDRRGTIAIVMSGALAANTKIATCTYAVSYGATAPFVFLPNQTSGVGLVNVNFYRLAVSTGVSFDLAANQALAAGTYTVGYIVEA